MSAARTPVADAIENTVRLAANTVEGACREHVFLGGFNAALAELRHRERRIAALEERLAEHGQERRRGR